MIIIFLGTFIKNRLKLEDRVDVIATHGLPTLWGYIAASLFAEKGQAERDIKYDGLIKGGNGLFLAYQLLGIATLSAWTIVITFLQVFVARLDYIGNLPHESVMIILKLKHSKPIYVILPFPFRE